MIAVDTHILIWDALSLERLSLAAAAAIAAANRSDGILIADISLWEIAMLIQKGRIQVETNSQSFLNLVLQANQLVVSGITPQIAALSTQLPLAINADPADRLIAATAIVEDAPLVTADHNLQKAEEVPTIW
jgi:PIN domain nuclease of toxin-antitoxin system